MTVIATLLVEGPPRSLAVLARAFTITVDGQVKGKVRAGRRLALALPPGAHSVQARDGVQAGPPLPVRLGPGLTTRIRVNRDGAGRPHLTETGPG
ncbi:hypothetical protein [Actinoplanes teichomyceticus]|uniref:PEGA domain-containing protein n=1 Tax=Actinoplanes teichomyceticus TaxID=1867 RepID=A0A561W9W9_ACTTI|nr:hypothetical protein [Actinoplanes teichomyceticus]TWG20643.1 hypothetical protein FHX34_103172 [Actinoplanes teichomyceticus]GIF14298.1 hypothetical protein Ate01nite_43300 [Actinoplanes teichomyceticus]